MSDDEFYEDERLLELVRSLSTRESAEEIRDRIITDVHGFAGDMDQSDDMTVVVVRRPPMPKPSEVNDVRVLPA